MANDLELEARSKQYKITGFGGVFLLLVILFVSNSDFLWIFSFKLTQVLTF